MAREIAGILFPVFVIACIGFGWSRTRAPFDTGFVARLVMNIAAPCLILDTLYHLELPVGDVLEVAAFGGLTIIISAVFAALSLRLAKQPIRSFLPILTFGNAGNMGLPLCLFAFGQTGLGLGIGVFVVAAISQLLLAPVLQDRQGVWRSLVRTPVVYAALVGIALLYTDAALPVAVTRPVSLLGQIAIPTMLLAMGYSLGQLRIANLQKALLLGIGRLAFGLAAGVIVAWIFQLEGVLRGVVILQSAMPAAVFNYLMAERYERHADEVAGGVVISAFVSVATLPLLLAWLLE